MSRAQALRRSPAPRHPRRVSGPVAPPRPVPVPGRPRPNTPVSVPHQTFGATLRALPDHRLLDIVLRSRAWIWLLGAALGGIVFMQVSLLGMNAGIGAAVAQSTELQHQNALLGQEVAALSSGARIEEAARLNGLVSPDAGDVGFVTTRGGLDASRAVERMTKPSDIARANLASGGAPPDAATAAAASVEAETAAAAAVEPVATAEPVTTAEPVVTTAPTVEPVASAAPPADPAVYEAGAAAAP